MKLVNDTNFYRVVKNTKNLACVGMILALTACGVGDVGPSGEVGPPGPKGDPATTVLTDIQELVERENNYRDAIGQQPIVEGLACTLYTVPNTATQIVGASLTTVGTFTHKNVINQADSPTSNGHSLLPANLRAVYQTWYVVKCSGYIVVADDNWHQFDLTSDDGSRLTLDGTLLINHDGMHGVSTKSASKFLKYGLHTVLVEYLQGNGNQALSLKMDGSLLQSERFYH